MRKQIIPLLLALSICLSVLLIELIPVWDPHSIAASQDKPTASEVAAAIEEQRQEAANMTRSQLADQKFQELNAKAQTDGTASVIVKLRVAFRPEGDLLSVAQVQAQRAVINQTQDLLIKELTGYDPASLKRFELVPFIAVKVNAAGLEALSLSSNIIDVYEDKLLEPTLAQSVPVVGAPIAWGLGFTGAGKTVAILDTGVDKNHPFLSGKVVSEACYSSNNTEEHATSLCPGGVTESTDANSGINCTGVSGCDHGTHVAGIAAGNGPTFSGVAKDATLISIQVFSRVTDTSECGGSSPCVRSFTSDLMKALERVFALRNTHSIASVNMSLGSGRFFSNCDTNPLKSIIDQLRSAGIATVIASGNDGFSDSISEPACISSAISVGATGDGTIIGENQVVFFSNSAPFLTMLAPGHAITSSIPGGGFANFDGTSMAAPHVAGGWAIFKQRNPTAGVTDILNMLTSRAIPVFDFRNGRTFPRLNLGPPPSCIASVPFDHWKGEYFGNTNLSGGATMVRDDGDSFLNFDIGAGSPSTTCELGVDNFSVRWTRNANFTIGVHRFTVTGDDGVRLFVDGQLKIDKFFNQAATTYTADVFLTTGNHEIKLEYFEGGGGALARVSWETLIGAECFVDVPFDQWKGEYFNNTTLTGNPTMVRNEGAGFIDLDIGIGSPGPACGLGVDNFSTRWTRRVSFTTGIYRFTVTGDDGVRFYIDGQLKIDKFFPQGANTYTIELFLQGGFHDLKLEYFEGGGNALARLSWETLEEGNCSVSVPFDHWRAAFSNGTTLSGPFVMTRDLGDGFLNFNVGAGSPGAACGLGADNFSATFQRNASFTTGIYRFTLTGDDGVRLFVDGNRVIDKFVNQAPTTYTADVFLSAGFHFINLHYFESGGGALAQLSWEPLTGPECFPNVPFDQWKGEFFNSTNLTGNLTMVRNEGPGFLNFDIGVGSPGPTCGLGVDNFSARFTRNVTFTTGVHRFTVTGDDGVRLFVDGQLKIDKFFPQGANTYTADVFLFSGGHNVRLDYFEGGGNALARVSWETVAGPECFAEVPFDQWKGEFFNNTTLTGAAGMVRNEGPGFLNFDIGVGSPGPACGFGADNFSARFTRFVNFAPGSYLFTVTADDGVRLWVGGRLVLDKWFPQAANTYTFNVTIFGGFQEVKLENFDGGGNALARVSWEALPSGCFTSFIPSDRWKGEYFNNPDVMGDPAVTRDDGPGFLGFDFGGGSPSPVCGMVADNFSARWTRFLFLQAGTHRFTVTGDDGVRLFINGALILDKWFEQGPTIYTVDVSTPFTGTHNIRFEFFERSGGAQARLTWGRIGP
jgi:subtilisin